MKYIDDSWNIGRGHSTSWQRTDVPGVGSFAKVTLYTPHGIVDVYRQWNDARPQDDFCKFWFIYRGRMYSREISGSQFDRACVREGFKFAREVVAGGKR